MSHTKRSPGGHRGDERLAGRPSSWPHDTTPPALDIDEGDLPGWARDNAELVLLALRRLQRDPLELVQLAMLEMAESAPFLLLQPGNEAAGPIVERQHDLVRQWLVSGRLALCPSCAQRTIFFTGDRFIDWPPPEHSCEIAAPRRPVRQRPGRVVPL